jgi:hypothetical protein
VLNKGGWDHFTGPWRVKVGVGLGVAVSLGVEVLVGVGVCVFVPVGVGSGVTLVRINAMSNADPTESRTGYPLLKTAPGVGAGGSIITTALSFQTGRRVFQPQGFSIPVPSG